MSVRHISLGETYRDLQVSIDTDSTQPVIFDPLTTNDAVLSRDEAIELAEWILHELRPPLKATLGRDDIQESWD